MPKFWLVTHSYPIYPKLGKSCVHTCILQSSNQNKTESKNLQPELFRGKHVWTHAHKHLWLQKICRKNRRFTRVRRTEIKHQPCYTCKNTSQFLVFVQGAAPRVFAYGGTFFRKLQFYQHKIFEHNQKLEVTTTLVTSRWGCVWISWFVWRSPKKYVLTILEAST